MIKKEVLPVILLFVFSNAFSQINRNVENRQITINFLLPGVVYETAMSNNETIAAELTVGFSLHGCSNCNTDYGIYPIGKLQYRFYNNLKLRKAKGKSIIGNSGNYIAPTLGVQGGKAIIGNLDYISDYTAVIGAVYGLQRTASKGFNFRFEAGPAFFFDEYNSDIGILLALKLGWVLNKKK